MSRAGQEKAQHPTRAVAGLLSRDWAGIIGSPLMLPAILLVTLIYSAPILGHWFSGDDFWLLRASQTTPIGEFIIEAFDYRDRDPVPQFGFYRPLYVISFRVCYALFGLDPLPYHALSIALHLTNVALLWHIARRLMRSDLAANATAFLFALHPAYTETLAWIARANTLMVTIVYLSALLLYMKFRDGGRRAQLYYAAAVVAAAVAVCYHTTAATLALVLPAYEFTVHRKPSAALSPRAWLPFVPFIAIAAVMLWIQKTGDVNLDEGFKIGWHQYTEFGQYLGLALLPVLPDDWLRADLPRLTLLIRLHQVASVVMIGLTLLLIDRRRWPFAGVFATAWLYVALAPNTTSLLVMPLIGAIPAQLYLPGASFSLFFVAAARTLNETLPEHIMQPVRRALPALCALAVALFVALGLSHQATSQDFSDEQKRFIDELRVEVPRVPPGGTLYVIDPPLILILFDDNALVAAIQLHYDDINVRRVGAVQLPEVLRKLGPKDRIYQHRATP